MARFEFLNSTQEEMGLHSRKRGAIQTIRSHVALFGHASKGTIVTADPNPVQLRTRRRSRTPRVTPAKLRLLPSSSSSQVNSSKDVMSSGYPTDDGTCSGCSRHLESKSAYTLFMSPTHNGLDAFLQLPIELSANECRCLQYCKCLTF